MSTAEQQILQQSLRHLGALAHQARASLRAADRFMTRDGDGDRESASWLVCTALELSCEIAEELDRLAKGLRDTGGDSARQQMLAPWRRNAHQLQASTRAADVYLEQDSADDQQTGTWLVASTLTLADRLAGALDDGIGAWVHAEPHRRIAPVELQAAAG